MKYLMVLNDGETFTDLEGCRIVAVPDDWDSDLEDWSGGSVLPEKAETILVYNAELVDSIGFVYRAFDK